MQIELIFSDRPILQIKNNLHEVTNLLDKHICKICMICMRNQSERDKPICKICMICMR